MRRNICWAEVRNHIPKRVPECPMLRNHSIIVIIFSLINFKKRLSRRDTDENWNSTKISVTLGMYLTRGSSVQRLLASGPRGWPFGQSPWSVGPTLQPLAGRFHGDTLQEAVTGNPKPKVGGDRTRWLPSHVVIDLTKLVTPPWTPINTPLPVEINTPHFTCSSPLVKVPI
jgi:hypothetical protein